MRTGKRSICVILSAAMVCTLFTGCSQSQISSVLDKAASKNVNASETISKSSKWINSDLAGAVTKDTTVSEKDDFATANNKDWILSVADQVKETGSVSVFDQNYDALVEQKQALLDTAINGGNFEPNKVGMDSTDYDHMTDTFTKVVSTAADWDARNKAGVEPLVDYISAISSIDSLDQMTTYLCNEDGSFLSGAYLIPFSVGQSLDPDSENYEVQLDSGFENSMEKTREIDDSLYQNYVMEMVTDVLKKLGYSSSAAKKTVKQCWQLETALSEHTSYKTVTSSKYVTQDVIEEQYHNTYTKEELKELCGNYPILDILKTYNYDQSDSYVVYEPNYVKFVSRLYKEKNLEKIKAYYIVHTVLIALPLLSRDYYDQYEAYFLGSAAAEKTEDTEEDDQKEEESLKELSKEDQILQNFVETYLNGIFEEMYLTNYCSTEQKEYLEKLIAEAIDEYKTILSGEDWLSDATKEKAIEKLNCITARVLYPDHLDDCNDLQVEKGNLLDIVSKITAYNMKKDSSRINTRFDKKGWDLQQLPTTTVNAFYSPKDNSISILAGAIASKELFDINASDEENMAHLGYVIGHEISHAFDSSGYMYDKDGKESKWWTDQDEEAFQKRVKKLANYYSGFCAYRTAEPVDGEMIQGEAIADTGGLKCMIAVGHQKENFDYQKFFRAFSHTWATSRKFSEESMAGAQDNHPLPFMRINVTVQQFEEFYEAFDIQPGDGMYLAPEKRISVW